MRRAPRALPVLPGFAPALALGAVLASGLAACEPTAPMSHPFQPAPVASAPAAVAGAPAAGTDPRFAAFDEAFRISSEEMGESDAEPPDAAAPPEAPAAPAAPAPAPLAAAASVPLVAPVPAAPLGWAIRLVATLPEAQPPRAILGLPDGREIVVTPGSMVPDAGLVVLAVGTQGVQVARVQATGDHATVDAVNLAPQY